MNENTKSTLPPSFPVEVWKDKLRVFKDAQEVKEHIKGLVKGVFPQEAFNDTRSIKMFLWRPHNYRLKIPFKRFLSLDTTPIRNIKVVSMFPVEVSNKNVIFVKVNPKLCIQVGRKGLVVIYASVKWFKVNSSDFEAFVDAKVDFIRGECLRAVEGLGLAQELNFDGIGWVRQENTLKGDEFLDSLPKSLVIDDTSFKKVYDDEVEFKDASFVKSFVKNRVLEDFGGYDARIGSLEVRVNRLNPLVFLMENVKKVSDVIVLKDYVLMLSDADKVVFTDWIFNNLGGFGGEIVIKSG